MTLTVSTIFYPKKYLEILEKSPENMICHFIGHSNETLVGVALSQFF
jgi:hypothetical protein